MNIDEYFDIFMLATKLYIYRMQLPICDRYPNYLTDYLDAIRIFLEGYAFERQGRNPSYSHAAVDAVNKVCSCQQGADFAEIVWTEYSGLLRGKGLNVNTNPLFHKETQCSCVWCKTKSENIIARAKEALRNSQVKEIWESIQNIRGIGQKIASFLLRDVSVKLGLYPVQNRWLLQPVDIWVRRTVAAINAKKMNDKEVAEFIVNNFNDPDVGCSWGYLSWSSSIQTARLRSARRPQRYDAVSTLKALHINRLCKRNYFS